MSSEGLSAPRATPGGLSNGIGPTAFQPATFQPSNPQTAMPTDLALDIRNTPLVDTHEHLDKEPGWVENGPADVLQDLFGNYVPADFVSAGVSPEALKRLTDASDPDLEGRFAGVRAAWEAIRFTGYGEA